MSAVFVHGDPLMTNYTPGSAVSANAVVVLNGNPHVAHRPIAANELGALAARNGVYRMVAAGNYGPGQKVFWNASSGKVVNAAATGAHPHFGFISSESDPAADGDSILVVHSPDGTASAT